MKILTPFFGGILIAGLLPTLLVAQTIAAGHTIRSKSIIVETDLVILASTIPGTFSTAEQIIGMEARTVLYPGRPIRYTDIGPPTVVERNAIVRLLYIKGGLIISTEGRALGRGGLGERIRVMNLSSRTTISGVITGSGEIRVIP